MHTEIKMTRGKSIIEFFKVCYRKTTKNLRIIL
jgi:hypothetical protein